MFLELQNISIWHFSSGFNFYRSSERERVQTRTKTKSTFPVCIQCRTYVYMSRWPHGLRHSSAAARLLRLRVRIPPGAWTSFVSPRLSVVSVVCCQKSLRQADHSSRGVLPALVRRCVWSRNLLKEENLAHWGLSRQKTNKRYVYVSNNHRSAMISIEYCCLSRKFPLYGRTLQNFRKIPMSLSSGWKSDVPRVKNMLIEGTKKKEPGCLGTATGRWSLVCAFKANRCRWHKVLLCIWHSQDRGSWYIVIIKANKVQYFSTVFW